MHLCASIYTQTYFLYVTFRLREPRGSRVLIGVLGRSPSRHDIFCNETSVFAIVVVFGDPKLTILGLMPLSWLSQCCDEKPSNEYDIIAVR